MPARTRRRDLTVTTAEDIRAAARLAALQEAAARAGRLHAWQAAARPRPGEPAPLDPPALDAAPTRKGFRWPFGRRPDPAAARKAQILAELQAAVAGRPRAGAAARAAQPEADPEAAPETALRRAAG